MRNGHRVRALTTISDDGAEVARAGDLGTVVVQPSPKCPYPTVQFERTGRACVVDPDEVTMVDVGFSFRPVSALLS